MDIVRGAALSGRPARPLVLLGVGSPARPAPALGSPRAGDPVPDGARAGYEPRDADGPGHDRWRAGVPGSPPRRRGLLSVGGGARGRAAQRGSGERANLRSGRTTAP